MKLDVSYQWKKERWHSLAVMANVAAQEIPVGSEAEFITEHYWGYTKIGTRTSEYQVEHPRWQVYPVKDYTIDADFGMLYGKQFGFLNSEKPKSVFLAEGSEITVRSGNKI